MESKAHNWFAEMISDTCFFYKYETSPRGMKIRENRNVQYSINPFFPLYENEYRSTPLKYFAAEMIWYLSGDRSVKWITQYSKFWERLADEAGLINSNYGDLIMKPNEHGVSGWVWAYESLKADKDTRQAILHFNDVSHRHFGNKDFPCTVYGLFSIRNSVLDFSINMRSSDIKMGIAFDIPFFSSLLQSMYLLLLENYPGLKIGLLNFFTNSLHAYENDWELLEKMSTSPISYNKMILKESLIDKNGVPNHKLTDQYNKPLEDISGSLNEWLEIE